MQGFEQGSTNIPVTLRRSTGNTGPGDRVAGVKGEEAGPTPTLPPLIQIAGLGAWVLVNFSVPRNSHQEMQAASLNSSWTSQTAQLHVQPWGLRRQMLTSLNQKLGPLAESKQLQAWCWEGPPWCLEAHPPGEGGGTSPQGSCSLGPSPAPVPRDRLALRMGQC